MKIEVLPWETELLGKKSGRVDAGDVVVDFDPGDHHFLSTRVAAGDEGRLAELARRGFEVVETALVFLRPASEPIRGGSAGVTIAMADDAGIEEAAGIAHDTFEHSRFHRDDRIPEEVARRSRAEWVRNAHRGRGEVFLARSDGDVVGFLVHVDRDDVSVLDLMGVAAARKREGIGASLVAAHLAERPARQHQVTTQATNLESIGLYQKAGYRYSTLSYSLHWHSA